MDRRYWKQFEIDFLKGNIESLGLEGCAKELSRSFRSVWNKAQKLHILPGDSRWWSEERIQMLRNLYGTMKNHEVAEKLGLTVSSMRCKAIRLGLKSPLMWTPEQDAFLRKHYEDMTRQKIGDVLEKTIAMVEHRASKLGLTRHNFYPEDRFCLDCGKKLANKYMKPVYCAECAAGHRKGENNPQWKGGVSSLYKLIQRNLYDVWKKPILERDGFECQLCGEHENLEVHHKTLLATIRDEVIAEYPELDFSIYENRLKLALMIVDRHTLDDGITLCNTCHIAYHTAKRDELLGNPNGKAEGNQQPSWGNVISIVPQKVQRATVEDITANKTDTSVPHTVPKCDDVLRACGRP